MRPGPRATALAALIVIALAAAGRPARADDDDEASLLIADARDALGGRRLDRAAALLDRALALDPRRLDAYVLRGSIHVARRDYPAAIALLRRAYALAPRNLDVLEALGGAEVLGGALDAGVARLDAVIVADGKRYQAYAALGAAHVRRNDWPRATVALEAYLRTRPRSLAGNDLRYRLDLANARLRAGDPAAARRSFEAILAAQPQAVEARLGRAWATAAVDCHAAQPELRALDELAATYPEIHEVQSRCALLIGDHAEALRAATRYRAHRPDRAAPYALLGEAQAASGDLPAALASLTSAIARAPGDAHHVLVLARVERQLGRHADAVRRLRTVTPPPGLADDWTLELGVATYDGGDAAGARAALEPLVARRADLPLARATLGMALFDLGELAAAIELLRRAVPAGTDRTDGDPRPRRALVRALNRDAARALAADDRAGATRALIEATMFADDATTWRNLGGVHLDGGDVPRALVALAQAGEDPIALYLRGRAQGAAGQWDAAVRSLEAAAKAPIDPGFAADVALELAVAQRGRDAPEDALATLERALATPDPAAAARLREAYFAAAQAAASEALAAARPAVAHRILDGAHARVDATTPDAVRIAIECDLALAASAIMRRDQALALLRPLARRKASCPFVAPADVLAIELLLAWNEGVGARARPALVRLDRLRPRATGVAAGLLSLAARDIAVRAAVDAFDRGKLRAAHELLDVARRHDRQSDEIAHNLAVLDLQLGHPDRALPVLVEMGERVPDALVTLGIAYEASGRSRDAVAAWEQARTARVRHPQLEAWIAAKRRLWGAP